MTFIRSMVAKAVAKFDEDPKKSQYVETIGLEQGGKLLLEITKTAEEFRVGLGYAAAYGHHGYNKLGTFYFRAGTRAIRRITRAIVRFIPSEEELYLMGARESLYRKCLRYDIPAGELDAKKLGHTIYFENMTKADIDFWDLYISQKFKLRTIGNNL